MTQRIKTATEPSIWVDDLLLAGYQTQQISLAEIEVAASEPAESLRAMLVRRNPPLRRRAVLYVHGWNDYFFQTHLADFFTELGYDFYALDLRRYGRSLVEGQFAGFTTAVEDYYVELDAAVELIRADHDQIVAMGHSTGGLVLSLYANDRPGLFSGLILNAPWLEVQAASVLRTITMPVASTLASGNPVYALPLVDAGFYQRVLHKDLDGEWDYDRRLKGNRAFRIRVGWLKAILAGHTRVAAGLEIDCPVLVMVSKRHDFRRTWHEGLRTCDTVLDVDQIVARAPALSDEVTIVRVQDALHDLVLSAPPVRAKVLETIRRWLALAS